MHKLKALKKRQDALKETIKNSIGDDREAIVGNFKVANKVIVSTTFDSKELKRVDIELWQKFSKENITTRLVVEEL